MSCNSSDDDGGDDVNGQRIETLIVTIDGQNISFNSIIVNRTALSDDGSFTEIDFTATIDGSTERIITFYSFVGDTGADGMYNFQYRENGIDYYENFNDFTSVITVNNGSRFEANFSGVLTGYDEEAQEEVTVNIGAGTIIVTY